MAGVASGLGDLGSASGPGGGGSDIVSGLGEALGQGFDAATGGDETPAGEAGTPASESPAESPAETPGGEAAAAAPEPQPAQTDQTPQPPQGEPSPAEASPWRLTRDGQSYLVPKGEFPRVQTAMQYADAVGQYFATPQDAQAGAMQASDLRSMSNDWQYGTDESIQSVLNHWAGANHQDPAARAAFQRSFAKMAQMAPGMLKQIDGNAYNAMLQSMGKALVDQMYERAAQTGNKDDFLAAQGVEWGLSPTGEYRKELPRMDPAAQQQQQWQQERQQFEQRQQAALQRDIGAFNQQAVEGAKFGQLTAAMDKLLEPVKSRFNETAYQDLRAGIQREVIDTLAKQDWYTEHKQNFDQLMADYRLTWRNGSPGAGLQPRIQSYIADFLARANRILPSIAQKRINANTQARVAQGTNGRPAPQASRTPAGQGRPASPAAPAQNGQHKRMSDDELYKQLGDLMR